MFIKAVKTSTWKYGAGTWLFIFKVWGEVLAGDRNSEVISTSQGLGSAKDSTLIREFS